MFEQKHFAQKNERTNATRKRMSEEKQEQSVLEVESPFPHNIDRFDGERNNEDSFPDLEFVVPGLDKPLMLHRFVLVPVSELVRNVLKCKRHHRFEWPFDTTTSNKAERDALVKVLRFCYGETMRVAPQEVCPVIAAVCRMQLKDTQSVVKKITDVAVDVASKDVCAGAAMLCDCTRFEECSNNNICQLNKALAGTVLSKHNMAEHSDVVVNDCLMHLPPMFLDAAQFVDEHQAFKVRVMFADRHKDTLSKDEQKAIVGKACGPHMSVDELEQLDGMGLFSEREVIKFAMNVAKKARIEVEATETKLDATEREPAHARSTSPEWLAHAVVRQTRSETTSIATGHTDAKASGAVFDDTRRIIVSVSLGSNKCRDVFVTQLTDATHGTTTCKKNLVPFDSTDHTPVFDGTKHVFFMECSFECDGKRFGRVDVDTWKYEELPPLPGTEFGVLFSGCWLDGKVFAVDADKQLCAFDVAHNTWSRCGVTVPSTDEEYVDVRLLSNPHDTQHIFVMVDNGGLHVVDLATRTVSLLSTPPVPFDVTRDVVLVGADKDTFVVVAALEDGAWHVFDSITKQWTWLDGWKPYDGEYNHNFLVFAPSLRSFFYHIEGKDKWEAVPLLVHK